MLNYAWLILVFPVLGLLLNLAFGRRLSDRTIGWIASSAVFLSFLVAVGLFFTLLGMPVEGRQHELMLWQWIHVDLFRADVKILVDPLSVTMGLIVTGVGFLIHVYSIGYMEGDKRVQRFFVFMNFFIFMMLTLVFANNFVLLYVGWEGVGLSSYLLIGFWFEKPIAAEAGKKAFLVNRVGDFGMALAIMWIFKLSGRLSFLDIAANTQAIAPAATGIALLLLLAVTGKSAQIPLYIWLPDAMEGPTPVSALIHAATMVTAGVYLVARTFAIFLLSPVAMTWVATIGVVTAFFAATMALAQVDLKRILAYSTISQIGYMVLGVGVGAFSAGIFHLMTHAFFKALLFLAAGSVMHALHGELDIRKMGGLREKMPQTFWTFLIGAAALAGFPLFSGFFSKDEILWHAWQHAHWMWALGLLTAFMTAYYSFRAVIVPFLGKPRDKYLFSHAHEAPPVMTIPLWLLAMGALLGGFLGLPHASLFGKWLEPVFASAHVGEGAASGNLELIFMGISSLVVLAGIGLAYYAYMVDTEFPNRFRKSLGFIDGLVQHKWYVDELYMAVIVHPLWELAGWFAKFFDPKVIDGTVNGLAWVTDEVGGGVRKLQTGLVGWYVFSLFVGAVLLLGYFMLVW